MAIMQPSSFVAGSSLVQTVEPIISAQPNIQVLVYDKKVSAPAAAMDLATAGAAFAALQMDAMATTRVSSISICSGRSTPFGIVGLADGAFILS